MRWYFPSWNGDVRLVDRDGVAVLLAVDPTPSELRQMGDFLRACKKRGWTKKSAHEGLISVGSDGKEREVARLTTSVAEAGPVLARIAQPSRAVLTAVRIAGGKIEVVDQSDVERVTEKVVKSEKLKSTLDVVEEKLKGSEEKAKPEVAKVDPPKEEETVAATVRRPTPCCPQCEPGSIEPAREVLLSFLDRRQHADWARHRAIVVEGGLTGHRYLLAHRNGPVAASVGRICYDLDDRSVVHFHDWRVPPEEEILASMLILQHREPWLRNQATIFSGGARFSNPFGDGSDGVADSTLAADFGELLAGSRDGVRGYGCWPKEIQPVAALLAGVVDSLRRPS